MVFEFWKHEFGGWNNFGKCDDGKYFVIQNFDGNFNLLMDNYTQLDMDR